MNSKDNIIIGWIWKIIGFIFLADVVFCGGDDNSLILAVLFTGFGMLMGKDV